MDQNGLTHESNTVLRRGPRVRLNEKRATVAYCGQRVVSGQKKKNRVDLLTIWEERRSVLFGWPFFFFLSLQRLHQNGKCMKNKGVVVKARRKGKKGQERWVYRQKETE